uniref:NADH dehydrogenase subunit 5 n=1 Tax=Dryophytes andersonii TaxID=242587 RepID=UPI0020287632|nr:NADH dehydrogenase subunit 5 [Dryophytes andersonii]UPO67297.1 NADH dehydrogenase subunit 5 [Dryophytes andersonii]UPO67427.1 NADH dehydrogenase subunit 5 [Dryophytes andersonii]UPO67440.1 NADH dehydrogenase subunit 5 [Dryophytes andersonii]UPO67453.1 NADH dehydrogenase subunit 5 [Dryophytes andersonii]UPO67466.1 NADH dehydrogenase subunit 5 [Dryophytes andersonii]
MNLLMAPLSSYILSMLVLIIPLLNPNSSNFHYKTKTAVMTAFFISTIPLLLMINETAEAMSISWKWFNILSTPINITIQLDHYSIIFIPIALMVTWSIVEYSLWYMHNDAKIQLFFKYLLIFLLAMMLLVSAGNFLMLFIGWEGVGIMSYLLIGWYFTRSNAGAAALQAVLYNRIGDIGFLFALFWLISFYDSIDLNFIFSMNHSTPLLLAFIIAAASKSAQFGLHPWLASAMEGPTPVSALLHSSTMVVAGVFLLIRIHPMIESNQTALTTCLCLGAISTAFAATCALTQNDIKKIIAYSTSSQLGLMVVAIGLNMPHLAFFHICTHAFFKAMLFLCSGSIIHNLNDEQDIRKMGGLQKTLPFTTSCVSVGSLALMGTPYLAGFFSKDAIIEAINTSNVNAWALALTIIATSFTAVYSLRIIYFASMMNPRFNVMVTINENNPTIINPIKRLAFGSVIAGLIINQIIIPTSPMIMTMPPHLKLTALMVSILGFTIALDLASISWTKTPKTLNLSKSVNTSFYPTTLHRLIPSSTLNFSLRTSSHLIDTLWLEKIGPKGLADLQLPPITKNQEIQQGLIKVYLSIFIFSTLICLIILQLA